MQEKYEKPTLYATFETLYNTEEKKDELVCVLGSFTNRQLAKSWSVDIGLVQKLRKWATFT